MIILGHLPFSPHINSAIEVFGVDEKLKGDSLEKHIMAIEKQEKETRKGKRLKNILEKKNEFSIARKFCFLPLSSTLFFSY